MSSFEQLKENPVNFARNMSDYDKEMITTKTSFLNAPKNFNERLYCYFHGITSHPLDVYGDPARFINIFEGYSTNLAPAIKELRGFITESKKKHRRIMASMTSDLKSDKRLNRIAKKKKDNASLYESDKVLGDDYIMCPITGVRMQSLRANWIEKYLEMNAEKFKELYVETRYISQSAINNVTAGMNKIGDDGLTVHQRAQLKVAKNLSAVDENGETGYQRLARKTRESHMANVDEFGRNGYQQLAQKRKTTTLPNGLTVEQNALVKQKQTMVANNLSGNAGASKLSKRVLRPIIQLLDTHNIKYYFDKSEYGVTDPDSGKTYFWDLTVPLLGLTIEYQSTAWHSNPFVDLTEWKKWSPPKGEKKTPEEVLKYDYDKARTLFKHRGIVTYYVWQKSQDRDVEDILCLLKTLITK